MSNDPPPTRRRRRRGLLDLLCLFGALAFATAALFLFLTHWASKHKQAVTASWEDQFGSLATFFERYPPRAANATALELEQLTPALGIDLVPAGLDRAPRAPREAHAPRVDVESYVSAELTRQGGRPSPPSPRVQGYLDEQRERIEGLIDRLLDRPPPRWELDPSQLMQMRLPNLMGHLKLQKLLAGYALERLHAADEPAALRALDAGWTLNTALRDEPVLIVQLVAMGATRLHAGTLRLVEHPPADWIERIGEHDHRASVLEALELEGRIVLELDSRDVMSSSEVVSGVLVEAVRPYLRLCTADIAQELRRELTNIEQLDYLCDRDLRALDADLDLSTAWWNRLESLVGLHQLESLPRRVGRLELDLELTRRLVELRLSETPALASARSWIETSSACPEDQWVYTVRREGAWELRLSRSPHWPDQTGLILPTRHISGDAPPDLLARRVGDLFGKLQGRRVRCPATLQSDAPESDFYCAETELDRDKVRRRVHAQVKNWQANGRFPGVRTVEDWTDVAGGWHRRYGTPQGTEFSVLVRRDGNVVVRHDRLAGSKLRTILNP